MGMANRLFTHEETRNVVGKIYAATLEDARKLHQQRIDDIRAQEKRDKDEENAAWCRLLDL